MHILTIVVPIHLYLIAVMLWYGFLLLGHSFVEDNSNSPYLKGFLRGSSSFFCSGIIFFVIADCFIYEALCWPRGFAFRCLLCIAFLLTSCLAAICLWTWRTLDSLPEIA